jgi:thiol-disulfide isomerase/thioredoxin
MSYLLPHLNNGWAVDQAILSEEERVVVIRFGHDYDPTCMQMDEVLYGIAELVKNYAVIYLVDTTEVPDFNTMYELYDPCTVMFFFRNKVCTPPRGRLCGGGGASLRPEPPCVCPLFPGMGNWLPTDPPPFLCTRGSTSWSISAPETITRSTGLSTTNRRWSTSLRQSTAVRARVVALSSRRRTTRQNTGTEMLELCGRDNS